MPQQGGVSGWSVDTPDEEARAMQQRLSDLTADGRMNRSEAMRQIQREDNQQLVDMNIEKAAQARAGARQPEAPAQERQEKEQPAASAQKRTLTFSEDREPRSQDYNSLKREQSESGPSQGQGQGRTLHFPEDRGQGLDRSR